VTGNRKGNQAEHADRGVEHDHVRHADHHVADELEEGEHGFAAFTQRRKAKAEDHRKENDLQHAALRHGFHRIDRNDLQKRRRQAGRRDRLGHQRVGRKIKTNARTDPVGKENAEKDGQRRGDGVHEQHFAGNAAELRGVGNTGAAGNNRGDDQRHHHHADQANEKLPEGLEVGLREG